MSEDALGLPDIKVMHRLSGRDFQYTFTELEEYVNFTCDVISVGEFGTFSSPESINFITLEAGKIEQNNKHCTLMSISLCLSFSIGQPN